MAFLMRARSVPGRARRVGAAVPALWLAAALLTPSPAARAATPEPVATPSAGVTEPRIYLSWNAPWGTPGASDTLSTDCADSTRVDTLYLSFEPGRDATQFYGMYARLYFRPQLGDTLGMFWHLKRGEENQGTLWAWFDPDGSFPCPRPWTAHGMGVPVWYTSPQAGRLDLVYAVRLDAASPVKAGTRYCFARVEFKERWPWLHGCRQPVCIEWESARLSFGFADESRKEIQATRGERFVSWNSPGGAVTEPYRRRVRPRAWQPPAGPAAPGPAAAPGDSAARPPGR